MDIKTSQDERNYRSFGEQTRHYFDRVHDGVPKTPIVSEADWRGPAMNLRVDEWQKLLTDDDVAELEMAARRAMQAGLTLEGLDSHNFSLPTLAERLALWRDEIRHGRGFVVIRGLPVEDWGETLSSYVYWGIGHHLGVPGAQNPQGELLGLVTDYSEESSNPIVRRYRTSGNIDFHCDAADVVGLLCLQKAKSGGHSRIASSVAIFNEVAKKHPAVIPRLFEPFFLDRRGEHSAGQPGFAQIAPCCWSDRQGLQTFYHSEYFRSATRLEGVVIDAKAAQAIELYDQCAASPDFHLDMWLEPGDMQFISNHTTLHSRTAYEDWPEQNRRRHLMRLWLSLK